jgi:hypothetical protein
MAVERSLEDSANDRCAFKEPIFVLTTKLITDPCLIILLRQALSFYLRKNFAAFVLAAASCRVQRVNRGKAANL